MVFLPWKKASKTGTNCWMKNKKYVLRIGVVVLCATALFFGNKHYQNYNAKIGDKIDSLDCVYVYFNSSFSNVSGRTVSADGYNIGLKYQCVEFVKRYYFEHYKHKMPNAYGNAIDFYDVRLNDGNFNTDRGLNQFSNPSNSKPKKGDLLVYSGTIGNPYGHVSIVAEVFSDQIEIIQQNGGGIYDTRANYNLVQINGKWEIKNNRILGWLRLK